MFCIFTRYNDQHGKCKFVLASESGLFKGERMGEHFPASYRCDMGEGLLLYSSSRYFIDKSGFPQDGYISIQVDKQLYNKWLIHNRHGRIH